MVIWLEDEALEEGGCTCIDVHCVLIMAFQCLVASAIDAFNGIVNQMRSLPAGGKVPHKPVELHSKAHGVAPPRSRLELPGHRSRGGQLCHQGHEDNLKTNFIIKAIKTT